MSDYIKELEQENEELRNKLAESENYNCFLLSRRGISFAYRVRPKRANSHMWLIPKKSLRELMELYKRVEWSEFVETINDINREWMCDTNFRGHEYLLILITMNTLKGFHRRYLRISQNKVSTERMDNG